MDNIKGALYAIGTIIILTILIIVINKTGFFSSHDRVVEIPQILAQQIETERSPIETYIKNRQNDYDETINPYDASGVSLEDSHIIKHIDISNTLINYVGRDEFNKWINSFKKEPNVHEATNINVISFTKHFKISQDDLYALLSSGAFYYTTSYDTAMIYGKESLKQQLYIIKLSTDEKKQKTNEEIKNESIWILKTALRDIVKVDRKDSAVFDSWVSEKNKSKDWVYSSSSKNVKTDIFTGDVRQWSIAEYVEVFDISKAEFQKAVEKVHAKYPHMKINISAVYEKSYEDFYKEAVQKAKFISSGEIKSLDPIYLDSNLFG